MLMLALATAPPAWSLSYFVYDQWGGTWQDANKNYKDDSLMCWAAAASNVLAWGKWGTATYTTTNSIFQHFKDHWTNNVGKAQVGWSWWFNGISPAASSKTSYVDVPGGGNFYPELTFSDYYRWGPYTEMEIINQYFHLGYGAAIGIVKGLTMGHALTVWGFDYQKNGKKDLYSFTSIYVTDSDDGVYGLMNYSLTLKNGLYYLGGKYDGWYIDEAVCLKTSPISGYGVVPLPSAISLLTGGLALLLLGKRKIIV